MGRIGLGMASLAAVVMCPAAASAQVSVGISVRVAPPPLPVYAQPALPGPDYLWTPGYWAWDEDAEAYFWVPGAWVRAPRPGYLWTPPWWGWSDGVYLFHEGYWGPHIGFYGGVPYGFGYTGFGYQGGYWNGGHVFYNRTVNNITNVHVTNVYRSTVIVNRINRVSYNGGPGGVQARPRAEEQQAARDAHFAPTGNQRQHFVAAHQDPRSFAPSGQDRPSSARTPQPFVSGRPQPRPDRAGFGGGRIPLDGRPRGAAPGVTVHYGNAAPPRPGDPYGSPRDDGRPFAPGNRPGRGSPPNAYGHFSQRDADRSDPRPAPRQPEHPHADPRPPMPRPQMPRPPQSRPPAPYPHPPAPHHDNERPR